jgi:hypothetical protein
VDEQAGWVALLGSAVSGGESTVSKINPSPFNGLDGQETVKRESKLHRSGFVPDRAGVAGGGPLHYAR